MLGFFFNPLDDCSRLLSCISDHKNSAQPRRDEYLIASTSSHTACKLCTYICVCGKWVHLLTLIQNETTQRIRDSQDEMAVEWDGRKHCRCQVLTRCDISKWDIQSVVVVVVVVEARDLFFAEGRDGDTKRITKIICFVPVTYRRCIAGLHSRILQYSFGILHHRFIAPLPCASHSSHRGRSSVVSIGVLLCPAYDYHNLIMWSTWGARCLIAHAHLPQCRCIIVPALSISIQQLNKRLLSRPEQMNPWCGKPREYCKKNDRARQTEVSWRSRHCDSPNLGWT